MADRRGLARVEVYRDGSCGLFQAGRGAIHVSTAALSTIPHGHDLCSLRVRACGEHGHLCRWHLRIGAASGKRYLAPGAACAMDGLFDDAADRLYCRSALLFVESALIDPLSIPTESQKQYPTPYIHTRFGRIRKALGTLSFLTAPTGTLVSCLLSFNS